MSTEQRSERALVAQGWILMFLVLLCLFYVEFANTLIEGRPSADQKEMMVILVVVSMFHAFVPMLVCTVDTPWFRWIIACVTGAMTLFMVVHQFGHIVMGGDELTFFNLLDLTHHALGLWVTVLAVRWARQTGSVRMPAASPQGAA